MTTPRDVRLNSTSVTPAFVEFDMSAEGFGCLYLPSIAPQSSPSQTVVNVGIAATVDSANISGVGTGTILLFFLRNVISLFVIGNA